MDHRHLATLICGLYAVTWLPVPGAEQTPAQDSFAAQIRPFLAKYCYACHSGEKARAGLHLDQFRSEQDVLQKREIWEKVGRAVRSHEMPPKGKPQPSGEERNRLASWVEQHLSKVNCSGPRDPGRVTLRRLNRTEYRNTIRDLTGVDYKPADDFPGDDVGYGFDNIGDVLTLPPVLMEKYLRAAEEIVEQVWAKPELRKKVFPVTAPANQPGARRGVLRQNLEYFAKRAWRRPVTQTELNKLLSLVELARTNGDDPETGIKLALQAVLVSPHFLFRVEQDPEPGQRIRALNDFEVATRLSYFLWSTMPDDELWTLAEKGKLLEQDVLEKQVRRMLQSARIRALAENFASQWLQVRNLASASPDPTQFPGFDDELRRAMYMEAVLFFETIAREDRSIADFLQADYTFVNERLAQHYGIPGVQGPEFRRVELRNGTRGGVVTLAGVLTVTSNPTRTSPVKRGKWVLENILGMPPPPPAPDAGELSEDPKVVESAPLRVRLEQHRRNASCAVCHQRMDPLGLALENYDAIGAWRERDGKFPVDASAELPDGTRFNGPQQLKEVLKTRIQDFRRCLTEKMLTYALGRGLEYYDKCTVDDIVKALAQKGDKFSVLVLGIVKSDPFLKRRGKEERP